MKLGFNFQYNNNELCRQTYVIISSAIINYRIIHYTLLTCLVLL